MLGDRKHMLFEEDGEAVPVSENLANVSLVSAKAAAAILAQSKLTV